MKNDVPPKPASSPGHKSSQNALLGARGEAAALAFIRSQQWDLVAKNWRPAGVYQGFEIDIIARDHGVLVFVEVKTRTGGQKVPVHTAFNKRKQRTMAEAARRYLSVENLWGTPCRFDLICLIRQPDDLFEVQHYAHVLEFGNALDSRHTTWQPW